MPDPFGSYRKSTSGFPLLCGDKSLICSPLGPLAYCTAKIGVVDYKGAKSHIYQFAVFWDFAQISIKNTALLFLRVISFLLCREVLYHVPFGTDLIGVVPHKLPGIQLPWSVSFVAVAEMLYESAETGDHVLRVRIYDPENKEIGDFQNKIQVAVGDATLIQPVVLGLRIDLYGRYTFDFEVDGIARKRRTVDVEGQS